MQLTGRTAVIVNGAQGSGLAVARALAGAGVRICLTDPEQEPADAAARGLGQTGIACDPADGSAVGRLAYAAGDLLGDIDIVVLVLNGATGRLTEATAEDDLDRLVAARMRPLVHVARHFGPAMRSRGQGQLLPVVQMPATADCWQDAAAGWVGTATRGLAADWSGSGVQVNAILALRDDSTALPRFMARAAPPAPVPLGRLAQPADIGAWVLHLCSDAARAVTGLVVPLDGGRHL